MPRAIDHFRKSLESAQRADSVGREYVAENEARAAVYPALASADTFERGEVNQEIGALLGSPALLSAKARTLLESVAANAPLPLTQVAACWKSYALVEASLRGSRTASREELAQFVALVKARQDTEANTRDALEVARSLATDDDWNAVMGLAPVAPVDELPAGELTFDLASVYQRFRARPENQRLSEREVTLRFYRHALTRHTGKSDQEIVDRLAREPQIDGSGSFPDEATTLRVVSAVVRANQAKVDDWMKTALPMAQLFLELELAPEVIGRDIVRGEPAVHDETYARVVLQKLDEKVYRLTTGHPAPAPEP